MLNNYTSLHTHLNGVEGILFVGVSVADRFSRYIRRGNSHSTTMSHPIALPPANHQDYMTMDPGSYTGENGQFNPASYTRHFLGSPISWRAGSFGAQFVPSQSPTAMLVGSYE